MGRIICKIYDDKSNTDLYFEWSTIVDAPLTKGMSLQDFRQYYKEEYGNRGLEEFNRKWISEVEKYGTSAGIGHSVQSLLDERALSRSTITLQQLIQILKQ